MQTGSGTNGSLGSGIGRAGSLQGNLPNTGSPGGNSFNSGSPGNSNASTVGGSPVGSGTGSLNPQSQSAPSTGSSGLGQRNSLLGGRDSGLDEGGAGGGGRSGGNSRGQGGGNGGSNRGAAGGRGIDPTGVSGSSSASGLGATQDNGADNLDTSGGVFGNNLSNGVTGARRNGASPRSGQPGAVGNYSGANTGKNNNGSYGSSDGQTSSGYRGASSGRSRMDPSTLQQDVRDGRPQGALSSDAQNRSSTGAQNNARNNRQQTARPTDGNGSPLDRTAESSEPQRGNLTQQSRRNAETLMNNEGAAARYDGGFSNRAANTAGGQNRAASDGSFDQTTGGARGTYYGGAGPGVGGNNGAKSRPNVGRADNSSDVKNASPTNNSAANLRNAPDNRGTAASWQDAYGFSMGANRGQTLTVSQVSSGGRAASAGLQPGDQFLSVNGQRLSSAQVLAGLLSGAGPEQQALIRVRRDGEDQTIRLNLGGQSQQNPSQAATRARAYGDF